MHPLFYYNAPPNNIKFESLTDLANMNLIILDKTGIHQLFWQALSAPYIIDVEN